MKIAVLILYAELPEQSRRFESLFDEFNVRYFSGRLMSYQVRVLFDLHRVAGEALHVNASRGMIRRQNGCIFLRYTQQTRMEETLIHEMAHAATHGNHDEEWLNEMRRLKAAGAPVPDWELEPSTEKSSYRIPKTEAATIILADADELSWCLDEVPEPDEEDEE